MMRSHQNTLIIVGIGTVVFGLWSVVKYAGLMLMRRSIILEEFRKSSDFVGIAQSGVSDNVVFNIMFGMVLTLLVMDLLFRLYIGASAVAEGRGTRRRKNGIYIFLAFIMVLIGITTIVTSIASGFNSHEPETVAMFGNESSVTTVIIEATSTVMLMQMIHSARMVRKYNRLGKHAKVK